MRVFEPLLHRNYELFWCSVLIVSVGQFVRELALYWLVYQITGLAIALGVLGFCEAAPRLASAMSGIHRNLPAPSDRAEEFRKPFRPKRAAAIISLSRQPPCPVPLDCREFHLRT